MDILMFPVGYKAHSSGRRANSVLGREGSGGRKGLDVKESVLPGGEEGEGTLRLMPEARR